MHGGVMCDDDCGAELPMAMLYMYTMWCIGVDKIEVSIWQLQLTWILRIILDPLRYGLWITALRQIYNYHRRGVRFFKLKLPGVGLADVDE